MRLPRGEGNTVTVLDDLSTVKLENLPAEDGRLRLHVRDVADQAALDSVLPGQDAAVHLAAVASVEASVREPIRTHRTNLEGSIRLFASAARLGVRRVIYTSSAAVYGNNADLPLSEESKKGPLSPYAADKLAGEHYLAHYHRLVRLDATAFRFFNVFGPRQDPSSPYSGVIRMFLDHARRGAPITVFGDGTQSRDFVYVGDVVRALAAALKRPTERPPVMPVFNVGRGSQVSLLQLLELVRGLPGVQPFDVQFGAPRHGDIHASVADVSRLRATGWEPRSALSDGLTQTLQSG